MMIQIILFAFQLRACPYSVGNSFGSNVILFIGVRYSIAIELLSPCDMNDMQFYQLLQYWLNIYLIATAKYVVIWSP